MNMMIKIYSLLSVLLLPCHGQNVLKQNLYVGQSVKLKCGVLERYVNIPMKFRWEKPIGNIIGTESTLSLQNVDFKDGGTYTCRASYSFNDKEVEKVLSTQLLINRRDPDSEPGGPTIPIEQPNIKFSDPDKDVLELAETEFLYSTCSVRNWINSDYEAKWMRYQKLLNGGNSNLFVFPLDTQRDSGTYTCQVYHKNFPEQKYERELRVEIKKPRFIIESLPGEDLRIGGRISRRCLIRNGKKSDYEQMTYFWMKDNTVNVSTSEILNIPITDESVGGQYSCFVSTTKGEKQYREPVQIKISTNGFRTPGGFKISIFTQPMSPELNKPFQLSCQIFPTIPNAQFQWTKDGRVVSNQQVLTLPQFQKSDIGSYSCKINNLRDPNAPPGTVPSSTSKIEFLYSTENKIELFERGSQMISRVGEKRELHCEIPTNVNMAGVGVKWFFNGREVDERSRNQYNAHRLDGAMVSILSLLRITTQNEGQYMCDVGGLKKSANLIILEEPTLMEINPAMVTKEEGESVEFHCRVNNLPGFSNTQVTWSFKSRDGRRIVPLNVHPRWTVMNNPNTPETSFLTTRRSQLDDDGFYSCTTPTGGQRVAELNVRPSVGNILLTISQEVLRVRANEPINIECSSFSAETGQPTGDPRFTFQSSRSLDQDRRFTENNNGPSRRRLTVPGGLSVFDNGLKVDCQYGGQTKTVTIYVDGDCPQNSRRCTDGTCVASEKFCDGVPDCRDGSDEASSACGNIVIILSPETVRTRVNEPITIECSSISSTIRQPMGEPKFFFQSGGSIDQDRRMIEQSAGQSKRRLLIIGGLSVADSGLKIDCRAGDQMKTITISVEGECPQYYRRCNDGTCQPSGRFCDGVRNCNDGSDEDPAFCNNILLIVTQETMRVKVNEPVTIECSSLSSITRQPMGEPRFSFQSGGSLDQDRRIIEHSAGQSKRILLIPGGLSVADSGMKIDCRAGDQRKTITISVEGECPQNYRRCNDGTCQPSGRFCDGVRNCNDGSDEDPAFCNNILLIVTQETIRVKVNEPITVECYSVSSTTGQPIGDPRFSFQFGRSLEQDPRFLETTVRNSRKRLSVPGGLSMSDNGVILECQSGGQRKTVTMYVEGECPPDHRRCKDLTCVQSGKFCDRVRDCSDGSDEAQDICSNIVLTITPETLRVRVNQPIVIECFSVVRDTAEPVGEPKFSLEYNRGLFQDPRLEETTVGQSRKRLSIARGLSMADSGMKVECRVGEQTRTAVIYLETECPQNYRRCSNGNCLPTGKFCDGVPDCPDGSDEVQSTCNLCDPVSSKCDYHRGKMPIKKSFLVHWRCDGENDCGNDYDESQCSEEDKRCSGMNFTCSDGKRIPRAYQCDNEPDCSNNEDESGCVMPQIIKSREDRIKRVRKGDSLKLICEGTSSPRPHILWRHNWGCLRDSARMYVSNSLRDCTTMVSVLTIQNFVGGDDGIYNCEVLSAQNRAFSDDFQVVLESV